MTGNIVDAAEKNQTMPPGAHGRAAPAIGWTRETIRGKIGCRYAGVPLAGPVTWRMRR